MERKGIILAGGSGSRLFPLTVAVSKQLLPVYDKPMIYYSLAVLMIANIKEILIITTPQDRAQFYRLLGDGSQWGIKLEYKVQESPDGLPQAFILAGEFLNGAPSALILGDNIFFGSGLEDFLIRANSRNKGATVFGYNVSDPERYGVATFDDEGMVRKITEKPKNPETNIAVTGLYFVDGTATERAKTLTPSKRGELEIADLLQGYIEANHLYLEKLNRGFAWFDTGTNNSLLSASEFVKTLSDRQGLLIGSPDEVAFRRGWISKADLIRRSRLYANNNYGKKLQEIAQNPRGF